MTNVSCGKRTVNLFDAFMLLVYVISIISVASLAFKVFNGHRVVLFSSIVTILFFFIKREYLVIDFTVKDSRHFLPLLLLVLAGLFFRSEPYLFSAGGQDQGVYVNMSRYFEENGTVFIEDELRNSLTEPMKVLYDKNNLRIENRENVRVNGKREGAFLPGIYVKNQKKSQYVFQFYHLHPLWMAIFGSFAGESHRVYSLVFFSILSIIGFYLLAFEFTRRRKTAVLAGLLIAINPLHSFFSKFPVTEVVALCFATLSFYYLLRYYNRAREGRTTPLELVLSSLSMFCMFLTRISGFMYLPFFLLVFFICELYESDSAIVKGIRQYVFMVVVLYGVSVWYGLKYSYPYCIDIYRSSIQRLLGHNWANLIYPLLVVSVLLFAGVFYLATSGKLKFFGKKLVWLRSLLPFIFIGILLLGLFFRAIPLGYSDKYCGHKWYDLRWNASGLGIDSLSYWSVTTLIEFLSPFAFLLFVILFLSNSYKGTGTRVLLELFILMFLFHISLLQWFLPYRYYYARYLLSEILPFSLLYIAICFPSSGRTKKLAQLLMVLAAIHMLFYSVKQFKGIELEEYNKCISQIRNLVSSQDILILEAENVRSYESLKTTLTYYCGFNVLLSTREDIDQFIWHLGISRNVFVLRTRPVVTNLSPMYKVSQQSVVQVTNDRFECVRTQIPRAFLLRKRSFYLLRYELDSIIEHSGIVYSDTFSRGISTGFYSDRVWTKGNVSITEIDLNLSYGRQLVIDTQGWRPVKPNGEEIDLKIQINGRQVGASYASNRIFIFEIPGEIHKIDSLELSCNTFVPEKIGMNDDGRELGIDIKSIYVRKSLPHPDSGEF